MSTASARSGTEQSGIEHTKKAIAAIARGEMVILVDDEDRENEGDLVMAAERVTPEAINFMAKYGRGLICLTLTEERLRELSIPMMVEDNTSSFGTAFTVSIEARHGVTTGISAADRARTVLVTLMPETKPDDLLRPGHIFPLRARKGGVLVRTGQTEGSVDLSRLAGLKPAGVICEIMNDDGSMARRPDLEQFAKTHGLLILTIADLIEYRLQHDELVSRAKQFDMKHSRFGNYRAVFYQSEVDEQQHVAFVFGDISGDAPVHVRVQTECGHLLGALMCDCAENTVAALEQLKQSGRGVFVGLAHGAPNNDLLAQVEQVASKRRSSGGMALREIGIGAQILRDLGLHRIHLLTNHPRKIPGLEGYGLSLESQLPLISGAIGALVEAAERTL